MTVHMKRVGDVGRSTVADRPDLRPRPAFAARLAVVLSIVAALLAGSTGSASATPVASARPATASAAVAQVATMASMTASCGAGRCTVYLSKADTRSLANGSAPRIPASVPWQLQVAYYGLVYGHVWFAQQYANRGWCSGFRLSIYPWESQGYFGYAC